MGIIFIILGITLVAVASLWLFLAYKLIQSPESIWSYDKEMDRYTRQRYRRANEAPVTEKNVSE